MAAKPRVTDDDPTAASGQSNNVQAIKPGIQIGASPGDSASALGLSPWEGASMSLKSGGGGGTSGGMSDDWKEDVKTQLSRLHYDVRGLLGGLVLLAGAAWAAYQAVDSKLGALSVSQASTDARVGAVESRLQSMDFKLDRLLDERRSNPEPKR